MHNFFCAYGFHTGHVIYCISECGSGMSCMVLYVLIQEREMGGGVFYEPLYRETFTQELRMLTK